MVDKSLSKNKKLKEEKKPKKKTIEPIPKFITKRMMVESPYVQNTTYISKKLLNPKFVKKMSNSIPIQNQAKKKPELKPLKKSLQIKEYPKKIEINLSRSISLPRRPKFRIASQNNHKRSHNVYVRLYDRHFEHLSKLPGSSYGCYRFKYEPRNNTEMTIAALQQRSWWKAAKGDEFAELIWWQTNYGINYNQFRDTGIKKSMTNNFEFCTKITTKDNLFKNLTLFCQVRKKKLIKEK